MLIALRITSTFERIHDSVKHFNLFVLSFFCNEFNLCVTMYANLNRLLFVNMSHNLHKYYRELSGFKSFFMFSISNHNIKLHWKLIPAVIYAQIIWCWSHFTVIIIKYATNRQVRVTYLFLIHFNGVLFIFWMRMR